MGGSWVLAGEHPEHPKGVPVKAKVEAKADSQVVQATVKGENVCLGCALKAEKGAAAQCRKYGHRHALKVVSVEVGGKPMPNFQGWVLHYLDNDQAQDLIQGRHGKVVAVKGKVYTEERVLEVDQVVDEGLKVKVPADHPEHPKHSEHPEHPK